MTPRNDDLAGVDLTGQYMEVDDFVFEDVSRPRSSAATRSGKKRSGNGGLAGFVLAGVGVAAVAGFGVAAFAKNITAPPSCSDMIKPASTAPGGISRLLVLNAPGNTAGAQADTANFMRTALADTDPAQTVNITTKFVVGDKTLQPEGCLAAPISIAPNKYDLERFTDDPSPHNLDVLVTQRNEAINTITDSAINVIKHLKKPGSTRPRIDTALETAAANAVGIDDVFVLTAVDLDADHCPVHASKTTTVTVQGCELAIGGLAGRLHLIRPDSVSVDGAQQAATTATFDAICGAVNCPTNK